MHRVEATLGPGSGFMAYSWRFDRPEECQVQGLGTVQRHDPKAGGGIYRL